MEYRLVCEIPAHEGPVRSLCIGPLGELISGSQDAKVRRWGPSEKPTSSGIEVSLDEFGTSLQHNHWVTALISLPPGKLESFPNGCIISGSQDSIIRIYDNLGDEVNRLEGHGKGVISFSWTPDLNLISGSWDGTARIWNIAEGRCLQVLPGHENGVHVLGLPNGIIATTSTGEQVNDRPANFFLRYWDPATGKQISSPRSDHTGSIRSICAFPPVGLATTSNDGTVVVRSVEGQPCHTHSHPPQEDGCSPFILDVTVLEMSGEGVGLISCGEDGSVMLWDAQGCIQAIPHPTCCWCAVGLPGGDFVTGGHDGVLRLFSRHPDKVSSPKALELQTLFLMQVEEAAEKKRQSASQGGLDPEELAKAPLWEHRAVHVGKADGVTKIFNRNGVGLAAQWSAASHTWIELGEIVGGGGDDGTVNGVKYDHVLPVEIDTSTGPQKLSLGYNNGENPYVAAQRFIDENLLSQYYLNQVADWIMARSSQQSRPTIDLAGGSGGGAGGRSGPVPLVGLPTSQHPHAIATAAPNTASGTASVAQIPLRFPLVFDEVPSGLSAKILPKIEGFNKSEESALSVGDLDNVSNVLNILGATSRYHSSEIPLHHIISVLKMTKWTSENIFPCYDILRMTTCHPSGEANLIRLDKQHKDQMIARAIDLMSSGSSTCHASSVTSIRFLANILKSESLRTSFVDAQLRALESWLSAVTSQCSSNNKLVRLSAVTLITNIIFIATNSSQQSMQISDLYVQALSILYEIIGSERDSVDVLYRSLLALGTVIFYSSSDTKSLIVELDFKSLLDEIQISWRGKLNEKIEKCLIEVKSLLL